MKCRRRYPKWMFRHIPKDWAYRKNPRVHQCKICSLFNPVRYKQTYTESGLKKLEPYNKTVVERLKEIFK